MNKTITQLAESIGEAVAECGLLSVSLGDADGLELASAAMALSAAQRHVNRALDRLRQLMARQHDTVEDIAL